MDYGDLLGGKMYLKTVRHSRFLVILVPYIEYFTNPVGTTGVPLSIFRNSRFCCYGNQNKKVVIWNEKALYFLSRAANLLKSTAIA